MKIYFAADHAGFELKNTLIAFVQGLGYEIEDCGAFQYDKNDDYPPIIAEAARKLSTDATSGKDSRAIVIGASGQGEAMVANRFRGVRCALYYATTVKNQNDMDGKTLSIIEGTRAHNDANALSLGARFVAVDEAKEVVRKWLEIPFSSEERHLRRIKQIDDLPAGRQGSHDQQRR